jgi:hypothetical protein
MTLPDAGRSPVTADETDAYIEAAIDRELGKSFFARPKQVCDLLDISLSTYHRAVRAKLIQITPRGDRLHGVSRITLRSLMKHGLRADCQ